MRRTPLHRAALSTAALALLAFGLLPAGCASGDGISISSQAYEGPPIEVGASGGQQIVKLTAPTGGWAFRLDTTRPQVEFTEVFVTAVRPNPAFMQTQALVTHELATGLAPDKQVRVYARVRPHDEEGGDYRRVALGASIGTNPAGRPLAP